MSQGTIHQVDRESLLAKLEKMGISPKAVYSENHAVVAVEEFVAFHGSEASEVVATGFEVTDTVDIDVDCTCPKCGTEFEWTENQEVGIEVEEDDIVDAVEVNSMSNTRPGALVLTPAEVAYILLHFVGVKNG